MRAVLGSVVLALVLATGAVTSLAIERQAAVAEDADTIAWETDLTVAREKAAKSGRPLMVVFR